MTMIVARILRVLQGHSPTAMVHARDRVGHEHKLEVPLESVRGVTAGQVLVLEWSVHDLPEMVVGEVVPPATRPAEEPKPGAAPTPAPTSTPTTAAAPSEEQMLEVMLGLTPGRLRSL
jgi:hypothetical protein